MTEVSSADVSQRPTGKVILRLLTDAGDAGELASVLARHFTAPLNQQRRNALTNHWLTRYQRHQYVRRSAVTEPSPVYKNTPVYRWFITDHGRAYLERGCVSELQQLRAELRAQDTQRMMHIHAVQLRALADGPALIAALPLKCLTRRTELVRALRRRYLTLEEIGQMMGVTRERIRQLEAGIDGHQCPDCVNEKKNS
jgi:hypothetical protein